MGILEQIEKRLSVVEQSAAEDAAPAVEQNRDFNDIMLAMEVLGFEVLSIRHSDRDFNQSTDRIVVDLHYLRAERK